MQVQENQGAVVKKNFKKNITNYLLIRFDIPLEGVVCLSSTTQLSARRHTSLARQPNH